MTRVLKILLVLLTAAFTVAGQGITPIGDKYGTTQAQNNLQALGWLAPGKVSDTPTVVAGIPIGALYVRSVDSVIYRFNGRTAVGVQHWIPWGNLTGNVQAVILNGDTLYGYVHINVPDSTSQLINNSGFITAAGAPVQSVNGQTGAVVINGSETKVVAGSNINVAGNGTIPTPYVVSAPGGFPNFSLHAISSSNFSTGVNCPLPALNGDSLQIFWNDINRFLEEGTEWAHLSGGGFVVLVPGFNAAVNNYSLTVYANTTAIPPGPLLETSASFTSATNCPVPQINGMTVTIFWNDVQRFLKPSEWTTLAGGGFQILVPGFNATTNNYSLYVFAQ